MATQTERTLERLVVYVGQLANGRHAAATNCSPYFYLEADSEKDLVAKVKSALSFYNEHTGLATPEVARPVVHKFNASRRLAQEELEVA